MVLRLSKTRLEAPSGFGLTHIRFYSDESVADYVHTLSPTGLASSGMFFSCYTSLALQLGDDNYPSANAEKVVDDDSPGQN